jgi:septum formation protein
MARVAGAGSGWQAAHAVSTSRGPLRGDARCGDRGLCRERRALRQAGAYAIQSSIAAWIEHIEGSHSGIMGLPLFETAQLLRRAGVTF